MNYAKQYCSAHNTLFYEVNEYKSVNINQGNLGEFINRIQQGDDFGSTAAVLILYSTHTRTYKSE